jgi:hypothetical protein
MRKFFLTVRAMVGRLFGGKNRKSPLAVSEEYERWLGI